MTAIISRQQINRRLDRFNNLAPDQIAAGLSFLARYSPETFDLVMDAAEIWDDGAQLYAACLGEAGI